MTSPLEPKAFRGDGVEIDLKTGKPKSASPLNREELNKALLGFKGGYGNQSLSSIWTLIDQYAQQVANEATQPYKIKLFEVATALKEAGFPKTALSLHEDLAELEKERKQ